MSERSHSWRSWRRVSSFWSVSDSSFSDSLKMIMGFRFLFRFIIVYLKLNGAFWANCTGILSFISIRYQFNLHDQFFLIFFFNY